MEAARSAMRAVKSPLPPRMVCDLYNTWFAVGAVVENIQKHSSLPADERESYVKTIRAELLKDAPDCVRAMKGKLLPFRRPDHAFSYYADKQCMVSQGAPIAAKGYDEGDANASVIVFGGCNSLIYYALGLTRVKPFSRALLEKYLALLEENHRKFG